MSRVPLPLVVLNLVTILACLALGWKILSVAPPGAAPVSAAPHIGTGVVYVSADGRKHAAICVGTADGEHWNLAVWMPTSETFTRFGIVEGEPDVPNTFHLVSPGR